MLPNQERRPFTFEAPSGPSVLRAKPYHPNDPPSSRNMPSFRDELFARFPLSAADPVNTDALLEDDLLGSFEDISHTARRQGQDNAPIAREVIRGLSGVNSVGPNHSRPPDISTFTGLTSSHPIHMHLPPRPDEITPDYVPPPPGLPRRISQPYTFPGPSSPPLLSDAGREIVFHPASESTQRNEYSLSEQSRQTSSSRFVSNGCEKDVLEPVQYTIRSSSPAHSKLFNTLATTTKLASKWKSALESSTTAALNGHSYPRPPPSQPSDLHSKTALPIAVTHTTPFASPEQVAGSYVAPSGAPCFDSRFTKAHEPVRPTEEVLSGIRLFGRREGTAEVLSPRIADQLRNYLPPRQKLSNTWTLLFSLDQHGASLATLYRLIDQYALTHESSGNILTVRDSSGVIFGVYLNEAIVKREGTYYGSGESYLFKVPPNQSNTRIFRWTGRNQYFALCEAGFVSFGGGAGAYGLLLDSTFSRNSSATCPAFDNEVLCTAKARYSDYATAFDCLALEVWGL